VDPKRFTTLRHDKDGNIILVSLRRYDEPGEKINRAAVRRFTAKHQNVSKR
jgi:hypothetical protein